MVCQAHGEEASHGEQESLHLSMIGNLLGVSCFKLSWDVQSLPSSDSSRDRNILCLSSHDKFRAMIS